MVSSEEEAPASLGLSNIGWGHLPETLRLFLPSSHHNRQRIQSIMGNAVINADANEYGVLYALGYSFLAISASIFPV